MTSQDQTRDRLLEAAGVEFAEKGFERATVSEITARAGTNRAAINYHFRDKQQLYNEAVLEAHRCGAAPPDLEAIEREPPAEQLRLFIRHFLTNVLAMQQNETWHHALMLREMLRPTEACEVVVREAIRPRFEGLQAILRRICPEIEPRRLNAMAFSVVGQCLHYRMARAVSERLIGEDAYQALDVDYLTEHISRFCLAALGVVEPFDRAGEPPPATARRRPASTKDGRPAPTTGGN